MPYGVASPASRIASHSSSPRRPSTLTSNASSPEKLTRQTRAGMPATSPSAIAMNGKLSVSSGSLPSAPASTSRESGPATATVAHCSVTDVSQTRRSGHSVWSHSSMWSSTPAALPVVVVQRYRSSPTRITTPSSKTMPSALHITA